MGGRFFSSSVSDGLVGILASSAQNVPEPALDSLCFVVFSDFIHHPGSDRYCDKLQSRCELGRFGTAAKASSPAEVALINVTKTIAQGKKSHWRDPGVLDQASFSLKTVPGITHGDWNIYFGFKMMTPFHWEQSRGGVMPADNPRQRLARYYLEQAVDSMLTIWYIDQLEYAGDLELLAEWYREAGDQQGLQGAKNKLEKYLQLPEAAIAVQGS